MVQHAMHDKDYYHYSQPVVYGIGWHTTHQFNRHVHIYLYVYMLPTATSSGGHCNRSHSHCRSHPQRARCVIRICYDRKPVCVCACMPPTTNVSHSHSPTMMTSARSNRFRVRLATRQANCVFSSRDLASLRHDRRTSETWLVGKKSGPRCDA